GQHRHGQTAVDRLTAGHRNGVVEQQFIGDVDPGGDRRTYRQHTRMSVGAVAEIGEDVRSFRERRLADPRRTFSAHLRKGRGGPVHELGEVVAAYAGERAAALRNLGGGVVRTARAEIWRAAERHHIAPELAFLRFQESETLGDPRRGMKASNSLRYDPGNPRRRQLAV